MTMNTDTCSSIVRLNIGGSIFCTTVDTLTHREPQSMLAAMFSGRHTIHKDSDTGYVFVDRDGTHFRHILNWLRDGVVPISNLSDLERLELLQEAEYYQLLGLVEMINMVLNKKKVDEKMDADLTRTDIIKCLQSKTKYFLKLRGVNLSGLDLSNLDLSNVDFSRACLKNINFSGAILRDAIFREANLEGANLEGADLKGDLLSVDLSRACLKNTNFSGAILRDANFSEANLEGADLKGADLGLAIFTGANLQHADLRHVTGYVFVDRDGTHFRHILNWLRDGVAPNLSDLERLELLREAEYYQLPGLVERINMVLNTKKADEKMDTDLTRTDIIKCLQSKSKYYLKLTGVNLSGLDLSNLDLSRVDLSRACLKNTNFSGAILRDANFSEANLEGAKLKGDLLNVDLSRACLKNTNFSGAILRNANFREANLEGANLKGVGLDFAYFTGANLQQAILK